MIKVDIVSGFLGAGKTTIIKMLARSLAARGVKTVIIENEFGAEDIDGKQLNLDGLTVYEITNGCLCCTLKEDFISAIIRVADKIRPDRVIIEPSGIFVLSEVFDIFTHEDIRGKLAVNSVTTVIDGLNYLAQKHKYGFFFENQLRFAQNAIISKAEEIKADDLLNITFELQRVNENLNIITSGLPGSRQEPSEYELMSLIEAVAGAPEPDLSGAPSPLLVHAHFNFTGFAVKPARQFGTGEFRAIMQRIAASDEFGAVLRAKGWLESPDGPYRFDFVNGSVDIEKTDRLPEGGPVISFIGEHMKKKQISALFD